MLNKKLIAIIIAAVFQSGYSQGWQFFGPDSMPWRNALQIDGVFRKDMPAKIAIASSIGIAAKLSQRWIYPFRNWTPQAPNFNSYVFFFSPWNDSAAFVGSSAMGGETLANFFLRVNNVSANSTWKIDYLTPSCVNDRAVSMVFPKNERKKVYAMVCDLYKSADNGRTWTKINQNFLGYNISFLRLNAFRDSNLYYAAKPYLGRDSLAIHFSYDGGLNWRRILTLPTSFTRTDMLALGDTLLLATSKGNIQEGVCGIYRSIDHGATWRQTRSGISVNALAAAGIHFEEIYAATQNGIYRSFDAGANWQVFNNTLPTRNLNDMIKDPYSDTLYVASDKGVYKVFGQVVSVNENHSREAPKKFSLYQNFPNPFNPATKIEYEVAQRAYVRLAVYDVMGRKIAELANGMHLPGRYRVAFDGSDFPSGVYFIRFAAGKEVEVRKITLVR